MKSQITIALLCSLILSGCAHGSQSTQMPAAQESRLKAAAEDPALEENPNALQTQFSDFQVKRDAVREFQKQSPAILLQKFGIVPQLSAQRLEGYQVTKQPYRDLDLEVGDVIIAINGSLPQNPDQYFEIWQNLDKQSSVVIDFMRQNQKRSLNWQIVD